MLVYLANFGYFLMLCAFVTRDVLWLRLLLALSQAVIVYYSWRNGVALISWWNLIFSAINFSMVVVILRERRAVEIPADLRDLHQRHFAALSPGEFMRWWSIGEDDLVNDRVLVLAGRQPQFLYFVRSGHVRVKRPGRAPLDVPSGHLIGEMSLLTGQPANADVEAAGRVLLRRWRTADLHQLRESKPALWAKIQSAVGFDLVLKIQRGEPQPAAGDALSGG